MVDAIYLIITLARCLCGCIFALLARNPNLLSQAWWRFIPLRLQQAREHFAWLLGPVSGRWAIRRIARGISNLKRRLRREPAPERKAQNPSRHGDLTGAISGVRIGTGPGRIQIDRLSAESSIGIMRRDILPRLGPPDTFHKPAKPSSVSS